jgi:ketosteroid isomerase-like protein
VAVLVSKIIAGKTTSPTTGISKEIRGPDAPFGVANSFELAANFLRSKLSPLAGTAVNVAVGKDLGGQPITATRTAAQLVTPLSIRDIYQAVQSEGVPEGSALGLVSLLGAGMQTFKASTQQQASLLYQATSAHPVRKSSETHEKFVKRKAAHEKAVLDAVQALKKIGVTSDPDLAEELLREEVKKRGGSYESVYHHVSALRRVLAEAEK